MSLVIKKKDRNTSLSNIDDVINEFCNVFPDHIGIFIAHMREVLDNLEDELDPKDIFETEDDEENEEE